jgi:hypothetical protein
LVRHSIYRQLGGTIEHDWSVDGLIVTVRLSRKKLSD